jgi:hypothetical protein
VTRAYRPGHRRPAGTRPDRSPGRRAHPHQTPQPRLPQPTAGQPRPGAALPTQSQHQHRVVRTARFTASPGGHDAALGRRPERSPSRALDPLCRRGRPGTASTRDASIAAGGSVAIAPGRGRPAPSCGTASVGSSVQGEASGLAEPRALSVLVRPRTLVPTWRVAYTRADADVVPEIGAVPHGLAHSRHVRDVVR